jgi:hypothetical protein
MAVNRAFSAARTAIDAKSLSRNSRIDQQRLEEIVLPALIREGLVRRIGTDDTAMYSWG